MKEINIVILVLLFVGLALYRRFTLKKEIYSDHREVYTRKVGPIPVGYQIHHINGIKGDNRVKNLIALPPHLHAWIHDFQYHKSTTEFIKYDKCILSKRAIQKLLNKYIKDNDKRKWPLKSKRGKNLAKFNQ